MNHIDIFTTALFQSTYTNFDSDKEKILKSVDEYLKENPTSVLKSNTQGYGFHSEENIHSCPDLQDLFNEICGLCVSYAKLLDLDVEHKIPAITSSWANIADNRMSSHAIHVHEGVISGSVYLEVPENSGQIVFHNYSINPLWMGNYLAKNKNQYTGLSLKVDPKEGEIVMWPSYLPHSVEQNNHDNKRISISFNCIFFDKPE